MRVFERTVPTEKSFDEAVAALERAAAEKGFRVLHTHDVPAALAEKGFPLGPLKIVEIYNARYASEVLDRDVRISLMFPCPISVYVEGGTTQICILLPTTISDFFPDAGIEAVAAQVEKTVLEIVYEAARYDHTGVRRRTPDRTVATAATTGPVAANLPLSETKHPQPRGGTRPRDRLASDRWDYTHLDSAPAGSGGGGRRGAAVGADLAQRCSSS
jgi:uncharacterized protein (DUF302 family)